MNLYQPTISLGSILIFLANLLFGGLLVAWVRTRPSMRKIEADREANLLTERAEEMEIMRNRIARLEKLMQEKEDEHAAAIKELEKHQAAKERFYEAQKAADRHRINNLNGAFQALLMLLKKGVAVEDAVAEIESLRVEQLAREAQESAAINAAAIKVGLIEGNEP